MRVADDHERAQLIAALRLSGDHATGDERWLRDHLSGCPECARVTASLEDGLAALRSISLAANPALVAVTQRRVREAAACLQEKQSGQRWLAFSSLVAAGMTAAAGISLGLALGPVARTLEVAPVTLAPVLLALWFLPGVLAGAAVWASQGSGFQWGRADRLFEQGRGVPR